MDETMKRVIVVRPAVGVVHMQVCVVADATDEEILAACNRENPSGTTLGWTTVNHSMNSNDNVLGCQGPVVCASFPDERRHMLVSC